MSEIKNVVITGAGGQIGYSLIFRIAAGELLGPTTKVNINLLEIPQAVASLEGVRMELDDCAFPMLNNVKFGSDADEIFTNADFVFLIGAKPRTQDMERKDLLTANAEIFAKQGKALNEVASSAVKILVVGNPANTNALIAMHNAPKLSPTNFSAMTRLDHNRTLSQVAQQTNSRTEDIKQVTIWGNHSSTQYPDIHHSTVGDKKVLDIVDDGWYKQVMIPAVQQRGTAIIKARGLSSAASAANAALGAMRDWQATQKTGWVSMAVHGGGYDIDSDLFYSFPTEVANGVPSIVTGLEINDYSRQMMAISEKELQEERDAVRHLLP